MMAMPMGDAALALQAAGDDLWATASPSGVGLIIAGGLVVAGVVLAVVLLRAKEAEPPPPAEASDEPSGAELAGELAAIAQARARLAAQLEGVPERLRAGITGQVERPLGELDRRVEVLAAAVRASAEAPPQGWLARERERMATRVAAEQDPRARSLLEASMRDLEQTEAARARLVRGARLALLEIARTRTLLDSLPARIQELVGRESLGETGEGGDMAIAHQLELALQRSGPVVDDVTRDVERFRTAAEVKA